MINLDDVQDGIEELERTANMGFAGAMITEYPLEDRRYDQPEYEPFWAAAQALDMPLSLHTATRTAKENPWRRGENAARRQQQGHESLLSGDFDVRHDLLGRVRALSPISSWRSWNLSWPGCRTCSPPWTTPTANAMRRLYIGLRMACVPVTFPSQCLAELPGG